jgi:ribonuclease P protein component
MDLRSECQQKAERKSSQEEGKEEEKNSPSLKRSHSIKKNSEFREIYRTGKRKNGENLSIVFVEKESFKYGISFSKNLKPVVKRNKLKRRIKEIIRGNKTLIQKGFHIVIRCSPSSLTLSFEKLSSELNRLFKEAEIIN